MKGVQQRVQSHNFFCDNAGPHQDSYYLWFMTDYCEQKGWEWEPQAPQMPYINNLDLCVFPIMSKRHLNLLQEYSGIVASRDDIWRAVESAWRDWHHLRLPTDSCWPIYHVAKKVIKSRGTSIFLKSGNFQSSIGNNFAAQHRGE
jgi:hypothetical protein